MGPGQFVRYNRGSLQQGNEKLTYILPKKSFYHFNLIF
jgi:hypothetical protein